MKSRIACAAFMLAVCVNLFTQENAPQKFALVIGNGNYTGLSRLANPVNDASDISAALKTLGFTVDTLLNASQSQMDDAVIRLKNRLSVTEESYGFFFYAGHGVQSGGENYLIPVDANIPDENFLRSRAVSVQTVLDVINDARNSLNVIVMDACRDNPFGWNRSTARGLAVLSRQPADSIIVYATSSGQTAADGQGRNGLFTNSLLQNLTRPGIEVYELFRRTSADVSDVSGRRQVPAVYSQFFSTAYLGTAPQGAFETGAVFTSTGALQIKTASAGTVEITGTNIRRTVELPEWGQLPIETIDAGTYKVLMRYTDGKTEEKIVTVGREETASLEFNYRPLPPKQPRVRVPADAQASRLNTLGFSVGSGFTAPLLTAALRGTFSPTRYSFLEAGADIGMLSARANTDYFSVYPFVRYALFLPFPALSGKQSSSGWYAGLGAGWMLGSHTVESEKIPVNIFAFDAVTGFILWDVLDLSFSLRTNFDGVNLKAQAGYVYRFK